MFSIVANPYLFGGAAITSNDAGRIFLPAVSGPTLYNEFSGTIRVPSNCKQLVILVGARNHEDVLGDCEFTLANCTLAASDGSNPVAFTLLSEMVFDATGGNDAQPGVGALIMQNPATGLRKLRIHLTDSNIRSAVAQAISFSGGHSVQPVANVESVSDKTLSTSPTIAITPVSSDSVIAGLAVITKSSNNDAGVAAGDIEETLKNGKTGNSSTADMGYLSGILRPTDTAEKDFTVTFPTAAKWAAIAVEASATPGESRMLLFEGAKEFLDGGTGPQTAANVAARSRDHVGKCINFCQQTNTNVIFGYVWHGYGVTWGKSLPARTVPKWNGTAFVDTLIPAGQSAYLPLYHSGSTASDYPLWADPTKDLLKEAITRYHAAGLEFFAGFTLFKREDSYNAFPEFKPPVIGSEPQKPDAVNDLHNPNFRRWLTGMIKEIIQYYDIDGLFFDYIRAGDGPHANLVWNARYVVDTGRNMEADQARISSVQGNGDPGTGQANDPRAVELDPAYATCLWHSSCIEEMLIDIRAFCNAKDTDIQIASYGDPFTAPTMYQGRLPHRWALLGLTDLFVRQAYGLEGIWDERPPPDGFGPAPYSRTLPYFVNEHGNLDPSVQDAWVPVNGTYEIAEGGGFRNQLTPPEPFLKTGDQLNQSALDCRSLHLGNGMAIYQAKDLFATSPDLGGTDPFYYPYAADQRLKLSQGAFASNSPVPPKWTRSNPNRAAAWPGEILYDGPVFDFAAPLVGAINLNGTTNIKRSGTGPIDHQSGFLSVALRRTSTAAALHTIIGADGHQPDSYLTMQSNFTLKFTANISTGLTLALDIRSLLANGVLPLDTWVNVLIAYDMTDAAHFGIYFQDTDVINAATTFVTNATIRQGSLTTTFGTNYQNGSGWVGDIAELWWEIGGGWHDPSDAAVRRKFYDISGNIELDKGVDGSDPFGNIPKYWFRGYPAPASFATNRGNATGTFQANNPLQPAIITPGYNP